MDTILFDLDGTLYNKKNDLYNVPGRRIKQIMKEIIQVPEEDIEVIYNELRMKYGSTILGLNKKYNIDLKQIFDYVHDIDIKSYWTGDKDIYTLFEALSERYELNIFTHSTHQYAEKFLKIGDLSDFVSSIWGIDDVEFYLKTSPESYNIVLQELKRKPNQVMIVEDSITNLSIPEKIGFKKMFYVHYDKPKSCNAKITSISSIYNLNNYLL